MPHKSYINLHNNWMKCPYYREGYSAPSNSDNPYEYDKEIDRKRLILAVKEGPLAAKERETLRELNEAFEATPYARWGMGNHMRDTLNE